MGKGQILQDYELHKEPLCFTLIQILIEFKQKHGMIWFMI